MIGGRQGPGAAGAMAAGVDPRAEMTSSKAARLHRNWQQQVERAPLRGRAGEAGNTTCYRTREPPRAAELPGSPPRSDVKEALKAEQRRRGGTCPVWPRPAAGPFEREREQIRSLSRDLPLLWYLPATTPADRQRIVRLLIDEVVVTVRGQSEWVDVTIHWAGGFTSGHELAPPGAALPVMVNGEQAPDRIIAPPSGGPQRWPRWPSS